MTSLRQEKWIGRGFYASRKDAKAQRNEGGARETGFKVRMAPFFPLCAFA
jgi:hypothetical protein